MQTAEQILQAIRKLGENHLPLTRIYRSLYSEDLFLAAYGKIYRNRGALTPGTDPTDSPDGMSIDRIRKLIANLRQERFHFRPAQRSYVPKKNGGQRPLARPNWSDKLVQEVLRQILEAYYEPRFKPSSHGFRPGRGCHTALAHISHQFQGTTWFIEGDIRGCFDNISHEVLLDILSRDIHDGRLLNLIRTSLKAGVVEDWKYEKTHSGTPQGGILSPILANIYLHELDTFVEKVLVPQYTRGKRRRANPEYQAYNHKIRRAKQRGEQETVKRLEQERRQLPSIDPQDPNFRRLSYCRYADDFILGFIGTKAEAIAIKDALSEFLQRELHLELSPEKTLITHARTEYARFLNYAISIVHQDDKLCHYECQGVPKKRRGINGCVRLSIPFGLIDEKCKRYMRAGKPREEFALHHFSDAQIIDIYQQRFRGVVEYYKYAVDRYRLGKLKHVMETALTKTLAMKYKRTVRQTYRTYHGRHTVDGFTYKTLQVEVPTNKGTRMIYWGAIPLRTMDVGTATIDDIVFHERIKMRSDLIERLRTNCCELCGTEGKCEVHHVRKLANLKKRWQGRKHKPEWVQRMVAMHRKTLVVCKPCHTDIHAGRPIPQSRIRKF